jgi:hypothetical protein
MSSTGYSRTPKLLKGAIIHFGAPMLLPIPNIIVFQYNPETMTRTLTPWQPAARTTEYNDDGTVKKVSALSGEQRYRLTQPYDPQEQFSLALELDATDALEHPESHPVAVISGVADRISALEMLLYPPGDSALGGLLGSIAGSLSASVSVGGASLSLGGALSGVADMLKRKQVPIVLFFWGPGRIVPVRITTFSVDEQQYSPLLYPIRAKVTVGMRVLDEDDLVTAEGDPAVGAVVDIAKACYKFTRAQKELLANANLANSVESIIGMLPI